jgi:hypothetical protein
MKCRNCQARYILSGARMHLLYDRCPDSNDADAAKILTSLQVSLPCYYEDAYEAVKETVKRIKYAD